MVLTSRNITGIDFVAAVYDRRKVSTTHTSVATTEANGEPVRFCYLNDWMLSVERRGNGFFQN